MVSGLVATTILKTIPGKPEWGKWTKDPPAVDWYVSLVNVFGVQRLVGHAYSGMQIAVATPDVPLYKLSFHEAQGVSVGATICISMFEF